MKDISLIVEQLKDKEIQIDRKINRTLGQNPDPFPFIRLEKGNKLLELFKMTLQSIVEDNLIQAGIHLRDLENEGLNLAFDYLHSIPYL